MGKRFLDIHVHSIESRGSSTREELKQFAKQIGTDIYFCDGSNPLEGRHIQFKKQSELDVKTPRAQYRIFEPLAKQDATVGRIKKSIIKTTLTAQLAKSMKKNGSAVELDLSTIIGAQSGERLRALKSVGTNLKYSRKYDVPMLVSSGAKSIYDLRSPYQAFHLLKVLGFTDSEAEDAMFNVPKSFLNTHNGR